MTKMGVSKRRIDGELRKDFSYVQANKNRENDVDDEIDTVPELS